MGKYDKAPLKPRVLIPEGKYPAILYLAADLGHQHDSFKGEDTIKHKIYLSWELVGTKVSDEDPRPFVIGDEYTVSASKFGGWYLSKTSNAYKMLKSWLNSDNPEPTKKVFCDLLFDAYPCVIDVVQQESRKDPSKVYNVMESIRPYKAKQVLKRENEMVDAIDFYRKNLDKLPDWLKRKIDSSLESTGEPIPTYKEKTEESDVPF